MSFVVVDKLAVPVFLGTRFIQRCIKSIHLTRRKTVPYHTTLVSMLMVQKAESKAEKKKSNATNLLNKTQHCWC